MLTLSYGYLKPQNGDLGSAFFPALAGDIQQLNDHIHDGITSAKLTAQSIIGVTDTISAVNWAATTGGTYQQTVTMPPNMNFDTYGMQFVVATGPSLGHVIHPSIERLSATTYKIYINDNSVDITVVYLV